MRVVFGKILATTEFIAMRAEPVVKEVTYHNSTRCFTWVLSLRVFAVPRLLRHARILIVGGRFCPESRRMTYRERPVLVGRGTLMPASGQQDFSQPPRYRARRRLAAARG